MTQRLDIVGGAILRGAYAKWFGRDSLADNPFPDFPRLLCAAQGVALRLLKFGARPGRP